MDAALAGEPVKAARQEATVTTRAALVIGLGAISLAAGCNDGVDANSGVTEPMSVSGSQFFSGPLPSGTKGPAVTVVNFPNQVMIAGASGASLSGDAEPTAMSVLFRFATMGTGYWVVPVGPPDSTNPGNNGWSTSASFSPLIQPGTYEVDFVAKDAQGNYGPVNKSTVSFRSSVPSSHERFSLSWDSNADLDLHVIAPDGSELTPKNRFTTQTVAKLPDGGFPTDVGQLDRDSNAACVEDAYRQENVTFAGDPAPGDYIFRVDEFSACGTVATNFVLKEFKDGKEVVENRRFGELLASQANGGGPGTGLTLLTRTFP